MINIAVVEDDNAAANTLSEFINAYGGQYNISFSVTRFTDAVSFLYNCKDSFDLVFMDIMLPKLNGMDAAAKLREFDKQTLLIFVTNMSQFAIKGYQVDALDFVVKPINYQDFVLKMKKAVKLIRLNEGKELVINHAGGITRVSTKRIMFIEVMGHKLSYHTADGVVSDYGSLSELEEKLREDNFMRCHNCYLVNPRFIASIEQHTVNMRDGTVLQISHPKKKKFVSDFMEWLGKGNYL